MGPTKGTRCVLRTPTPQLQIDALDSQYIYNSLFLVKF